MYGFTMSAILCAKLFCSLLREMGMKKAELFSKSGCNWWVTPGSNPSSKEKRANPIYENETQFLREKSPQTLGITGKNIAEHFCSAMMVGEGGFEPPKALLTDLQSAPFGHSGTHP